MLRLTQSQSHIATDDQSVSKSWYRAPSGAHDQIFISVWHVLVSVGSVFCICRWPLPAQSFSGPSPLGLATVFYYLRFETSHFVAFYDSQGHGGGIRLRLHTGYCSLTADSPTDSCYIASVRTTTQKTPLLYYWPRVCCGRCLATGVCVTVFYCRDRGKSPNSCQDSRSIRYTNRSTWMSFSNVLGMYVYSIVHSTRLHSCYHNSHVEFWIIWYTTDLVCCHMHWQWE
jgi:hypothetical protein